MPTDTPPRSRIPAPISRATGTPSRLAPPGTTQKSSGSLRPPPAPSPSPAAKARAKTPVGAATPKRPSPAPAVPTAEVPALETGMAKVSLKEQIAARRAAMKTGPKKVGVVGRPSGGVGRALDEQWGDGRGVRTHEEEDLLGRPSVLVDITRAKTSGKLDLSFRSLPCLPYALFNLHLGIEPSFPPPPGRDEREKDVPQPAFYECVDLVSLKARDNEIEKVQDEISYFAALKVVDFNRNKLTSLPPTFAELQGLVDLSLANNLFTTLPTPLASLTSLISLDISHNPLPTISSLPSSLRTLIATNCKLSLSSLSSLPRGLITLDISHNSLGPSPRLSSVLEPLEELKHLTAASCELDGADFKGEGWWTGRLETLELGGVKKEAWEVELETRGKRRRAMVVEPEPEETDRRSAAVAATAGAPETASSSNDPDPSTILTAYYHSPTFTLTLPASRSRPPPPVSLPRCTLPVTLILALPFAQTLKTLVLTSRDADPVIEWDGEGVLEGVEEVKMDGCGLGEEVRVRTAGGQERAEPLLPLLARVFPSLRLLDISYNRLPGLAHLSDILFLPSGSPTKLHTLRLRGCGIDDLSPLLSLISAHPPETSTWALRELDISENELTKLPPEVGRLRMDVLLVEGNRFRIPARKVWEQGGSAGLLGWLRERGSR